MELSCNLHHLENYVSLCLKKQCMAFLCPQCIPNHTNYHSNLKNHPQYIDIHSAYFYIQKSAQEMIQNSISKHRRIEKQINQFLQNRKNNIFKLKKLRNEYLKIVNNYFDQQQNIFVEKINKEDNKGRSQLTFKEIQAIENQLKGNIQIIRKTKQQMNSSNIALQYSRIKQIYNKIQTYKQITENCKQYLKIEFNQQFRNKLKETFENILIPNFEKNKSKSIFKKKKEKTDINCIQKENKFSESPKNVNWAWPLSKDIYKFQNSDKSTNLTQRRLTPKVFPNHQFQHSVSEYELNKTYPKYSQQATQSPNNHNSINYSKSYSNMVNCQPIKKQSFMNNFGNNAGFCFSTSNRSPKEIQYLSKDNSFNVKGQMVRKYSQNYVRLI